MKYKITKSLKILDRPVHLYFMTKYKNILTWNLKYHRGVMRSKEFILYGVTRACYIHCEIRYNIATVHKGGRTVPSVIVVRLSQK